MEKKYNKSVKRTSCERSLASTKFCKYPTHFNCLLWLCVCEMFYQICSFKCPIVLEMLRSCLSLPWLRKYSLNRNTCRQGWPCSILGGFVFLPGTISDNIQQLKLHLLTGHLYYVKNDHCATNGCPGTNRQSHNAHPIYSRAAPAGGCQFASRR